MFLLFLLVNFKEEEEKIVDWKKIERKIDFLMTSLKAGNFVDFNGI